MQFLNSIPLIGITLGLFMLLLIAPDRKNYLQNKLAKFFLLSIIILSTVNQLDAYLSFNNYINESSSGISYVFYHLFGSIFYLYVLALQKHKKLIIKWGIIIGIYTFIRLIALTVIDYYTIDWNTHDNSISSFVILTDAYLSQIINITFMIAAFMSLNKINFSVTLTPDNKRNVLWLSRVIIASVIIYLIALIFNIVSDFQRVPWYKQAKVENSFTNLLFYIIAFFAVKFPMFSIDGDYKENSSIEAKKYVNSSLNQSESKLLWQKINIQMRDQKLYRSPDFRLNHLAETLNKSVNHISQVINEESDSNFSDLVNKYRIEEAKELLLTKKSKKLTILAIAYEVGFNSKSTFYTAFKKECGMTPSVYSKKHA